jgi:phage recombination protein Bet
MANAAKKLKVRRRKPAKPPQRPRPKNGAPSKAIALRVPTLSRSGELGPDEITLIKNTIAKGASDDELRMFLGIAKRHRLDPFTHQIWLVPRWDSQADSGQKTPDGQPILGAYVRTTQVGIDGFLHIAARDHKDFGSVSLPEFGPMTDFAVDGVKFKAPEWARVTVHKKGLAEPTVAEAWFEEYHPTKMSKAPFWRRMPRRMIAKCATALALRQAYPDLSGIYIPEECEKMAEDTTTGGRQIIEGPNPSLDKYKERESEQLKMLTPAQREVVERRMKEAEAKKAAVVDAEYVDPTVDLQPAEKVLYYEQHGENYLITGNDVLKTENRELLGPLWSKKEKAIIATPADLGKLISRFEGKVPFRRKE